MTIRRPRWPAIAASLAVIAAVAGVTLGVTTLLGVTFQGSGSAQQGPGVTRTGFLQTSNRDRLAICVKAVGVDPSAESTMRLAIEKTLTKLAQHPVWVANRLGDAAPVVDTGCAAEPGLYDTKSFTYPPRSFFEITGRIVSSPDIHLVLVFILPPEEIARFAGKGNFRLSAEEFLCYLDSCVGVTTGVYLSPAEAGDLDFLTDTLAKAIGLERPF